MTAREAVEAALDRITAVDVHTNAVCTVSATALEVADERDRELADGFSRGPLHGRCVLVKDNTDTADLPTTAGSLALAGDPPAQDATLVARLRKAGLVVLGKTNLSEWSNLRDPSSTSGWSAFGGLTRNPYALNRSAGGSSSGSGVAVAARMVPFAVGTETDGSIICPAAFNGCVGLKPTVGLIPSTGIIPISSSQDTAGPMALTVRDAAALLSVLAGGVADYAASAVDHGLAGKRIGVPRDHFWGYSDAADVAAERALALMAEHGAVIVDNTDLVSMRDYGFDDELQVMLAEMRQGLDAYLATRTGDVPRTLAEVVDFNRQHADEELSWFGQSYFEQALEVPGIDSPEYAAARRSCIEHGRTHGIDAVLAAHGLDALITPSYSPAIPIDLVNAEYHAGGCTQPAAMAGYPLLSVPSGLVKGLPVGVSFWGTAWSEPTLIEIAHAYERVRDRVDGPLPAPTFPAFV